MADILYTNFKKHIGDGTFDLDTDTFKIALLSSSYTPTATHEVFATVGTYEVSGTGYTAGGLTLTGVTWTISGSSSIWTATNPSWTASTITARYAVIYKSGTANSLTNPLVCCFDFGADKITTNGTFVINFNSSGIFSLT